MGDTSNFLNKLAKDGYSRDQLSIALLWHYRETQEYEERTPSELASDLEELGYSKPKVPWLRQKLNKSKFTINGKRKNTKRINVRYLSELFEKYNKFLKIERPQVSDAIIPLEWITSSRSYLEKLVFQINGTYDYGFYDGCATMCRRLLETLIIEVYVNARRHNEIKSNGVFLGLEKLILYITSDRSLTLARDAKKTMDYIKEVGDIAAHHRTYSTLKTDIDEMKHKYRRLVQELLVLGKLTN